MMKRIVCFCLMLLLSLLPACASPVELETGKRKIEPFAEDASLLTIRFLNTDTPMNVKNGSHTMSDCFLLTYDGLTMLIDCSADFVAEDILVSRLKQLGVTQIDCVVTTHPHGDHIGGFSAFAEAFPIGALYTCFPLDENERQIEAVEAARRHGIPVIRLEDEDSIAFSDLVIRTYSDEEKRGLNCASMIMHIRRGDSALLLLADSETMAQKRLNLIWGEEAKCDIVKLAHHGINLPSYSFMQSARPRLAVVTNGWSESLRDAVTMVHNVGCGDVLYTANGDIVCTTDGTRWIVRQEWE